MARKSNTNLKRPNTTVKRVNVQRVQGKNDVQNKIKAAKRLIETCDRELFKTEYGLITIRGIENLTRSEVESIINYCQYFIENKTIGGLMPPIGSVAEVLNKINLIPKLEEW